MDAISIESTVNKENNDMVKLNENLGYQTSHLKCLKN